MAIAFLGSTLTDNATITSTCEVAVPAEVVDNCVMLAQIIWDGNARTITEDAAWTPIIETQDGARLHAGVYYRVVTSAASEPATYTWSEGSAGADQNSGMIVAYSGVDTTTPLDAASPFYTQNVAASVNPYVSGITTQTDNAWVLFFCAVDDQAGKTLSPGTPTTIERVESSANVGGVYDLEWPTAGDTGQIEITLSAIDNFIATLVALRPAAGGGSTPLTVQDATHAHAADNVALSVSGALSVADAGHAHTSDNVALTQHNILAVADATHAHTADNIGVGIVHVGLIGDSITAGAGEWWEYFDDDYNGGNVTLYNKAASGATVNTHMAGQVTAMASDPVNIIIIMLGVNDGDTLNQTTYETNVATLKTNHPEAEIYAVGVLPVSSSNPTATANETERQTTNDIIYAASQEAGIAYWDTDGWIDPATETSDGAHPNATGDAKISTRIIGNLTGSNIVDVAVDWSTHLEDANGSDNFPMTWDQNGHQYAFFSDGGGFSGNNTNGRVGLGIARIEGPRDAWVGHDINGGLTPESGTSTLDTLTSAGKSYAIISLDGVIYGYYGPGSNQTSWDRTRLIKSIDLGETWTDFSAVEWTDVTEGVGFPFIIQYGQNYEHNTDGYLYVGWHNKKQDTFGIQTPGEICLTRVALASIETKSSYEWYTGSGWSSDYTQRSPVLTDAAGVGPVSSAIYLAGLGKYVAITQHTNQASGELKWWQSYNPWGPWTSFRTDTDWGDTHILLTTFYWNISPKWMYGRDRNFTLVFTGSGDSDSFNTIEGAFSTTQSGLVVQDAAHAHTVDNVALTQHHSLTVQDASHAHTTDATILDVALITSDATASHSADNVTLSISTEFVVHDATHAHTVDAIALDVALIVGDVTASHSADNVTLGDVIDQLVVQDATHAHTADSVALVQHYALTVAGTVHGHTTDNVALTQHHVLAVDDTTHTHSADNVALGVAGVLVVQDAVHVHTADNVALTQHHALTVDDAIHTHTADSVALTQNYALAVADATHAHSVDNVALTQHHVLAIADAAHGHTATNVTLAAAGQLAVQDATHGHTADAVVLTQHYALAVQDAVHAHTAESVSLTVALVVQDATHSHGVDSVALTQNYALTVAGATHAHSADGVQLELPGQLAPQNTQHGHTAGNVALTQHNVLAVADATHAHTADNVALIPSVQLTVQSATHTHTVDSPSLVVMLIIASAQHGHTADNASLTQHYALTVQDATHIHRVDNILFTGAILLDWAVADSRVTLWSLVDSSRT